MKLNIDTIYNEDCLSFIPKMDNSTIDMVMTSPPYNTSRDGGNLQRTSSRYLKETFSDEKTPEEAVTVPSVAGLSKEYAKELLHSVGLNMTTGMSTTGEDDLTAVETELAGKTVPLGTAVPVSFQQSSIQSQ